MEVLLTFYDEQFKIILPQSYDHLLKEISEKYHIPKNELNQLQLLYKDDDSDTIVIQSNEDLDQFKKQAEKNRAKEIQIELNENSKMFLSQFHNKDSFVHIANEPTILNEKCCSCLIIMKNNEGVNCVKCGFILCDKCKTDFFHQHPLIQRNYVEGNKNGKRDDEGYFYNFISLLKKIPATMESMFYKNGVDPYEELIKKARVLYDLRNVSNDQLKYALMKSNGSIENAIILLAQGY